MGRGGVLIRIGLLARCSFSPAFLIVDKFGLLIGIQVLARRFGDSCLAQLNLPFRLSFSSVSVTLRLNGDANIDIMLAVDRPRRT